MELKQQERSAVFQKKANLQVIQAEKPLQYDKKVYQTLESLDQINISHIVFVFLFFGWLPIVCSLVCNRGGSGRYRNRYTTVFVTNYDSFGIILFIGPADTPATW